MLELDFKIGDDGRYNCNKCKASYKNKKHVRRHLIYECGVEPKFECKKCFKNSNTTIISNNTLLVETQTDTAFESLVSSKPSLIDVTFFKIEVEDDFLIDN
ncbi:hypothetical protein WA026_023234 [Henosepilachna vigintioctopunctata]|uniref:C2H2-type domain-containing protein n=1 Tax=Henosepilachna vigintioctopunctata TaxID=420089 RepID=A0AAW1VBF5_9CUCU